MNKKIMYVSKSILCLLFSCFLLFATLPVTSVSAAENSDSGTPSGAPAVPSLSHDNWDGKVSYQIQFDIWWGNNATSFKLYEDNALINEGGLEADSPNAQSKSFPIEKKENGTYAYKIELTNAYGTTTSNTVSVTVTNASTTPEEPDITTVETPALSIPGGTYNEAQSVEITCATPDASIFYTVDGAVPSGNSLLYSGPVTISKTTLLKALAIKDGMQNSDVATANYVIREGGGDPGQPTPGLQKRLLVGYWHTWGGDASGGVPFIRLRDVDKNWDVINISFAEPVSPGSIDGKMQLNISGLTTDYTKENFKDDIADLQAEGKKVVLSIGGYLGYFSLTSQDAVNQFVGDIKSIVDEYGFNGIDIDLEQTSVTFDSGADPDYRNPVSPKIVYMIQAIREICNSYEDDFILSWAPETFYAQLGYQFYGGLNAYCDSRAGVYLPMIHALRDKTSYVHVQLYNSMAITGSDGISYSMGSAETTVAMCRMLLDGFNIGGRQNYYFEPLRPDQVVIGVPASALAAGSGQISNENLQNAFSTLENTYPGIRGIMTWSINWDAHQNGSSFAQDNGQFLDGLN